MSLFNIKFIVKCITFPGQDVYISGNTADLGNWSPQNSLRLYTDPTIYPRWNSLKTIQIRQGNKILFKICIINKQNHLSRWQNIQVDREIIINTNSIIQFAANQPKLSIIPFYQPIKDIIPIKPPRKKTIQILNQLQSDGGSSSNQYWMSFQREDDESVLYLTLMTHMRRLIEHQNDYYINMLNQQVMDMKMRKEKSHDFDQEVKTNILKLNEEKIKSANICIIMKQGNNINLNDKDNQALEVNLFSNIAQVSYIQDSQFIGLSCVYFNINNNVNRCLIFHIQSLKQQNQNSMLIRVFESIRNIHTNNQSLECYISMKLSWRINKQIVEKILLNRVSCIIFQDQEVLDGFLKEVIQLGLQYYIQSQSQILLMLENYYVMKLKMVWKKQQKFTHNHSYRCMYNNNNSNNNSNNNNNNNNNNYIDNNSNNNNNEQKSQQNMTKQYQLMIKELIFRTSKQFYYFGGNDENFLQSIRQDEAFLYLKTNFKNIFIFRAQKIQDFSDKILKQIVQLSSKQNIQIYIILSKLTQNIRQRFLVSKNNKVVFLGKNGYFYGNQDKLMDLFEKLSIQKQKNKFIDALKQIDKQVTLGVIKKNYYLSGLQISLQFRKNNFGHKAIQYLRYKIRQINKKSLCKIFYQRQSDNPYIIILRPFILTEEFFLKSIFQTLSKSIEDDKAVVIAINLADSTSLSIESRFIQKVNTLYLKNFKGRQNVKLRNFEVINNENQISCGITKEQVINVQILGKFLQFLCQHFLAGSQIKTYPVHNMSTTKRNKKIYIQSRKKFQSFGSDNNF